MALTFICMLLKQNVIKFKYGNSNRLKECRSSQDLRKAHQCSRPLGLQFNKMTRDLYIADAQLGLLTVGYGDKFATPIVTHVQGLPLHFTNGLEIDQQNGIIYFTDSSTRFRRRYCPPKTKFFFLISRCIHSVYWQCILGFYTGKITC